MSAPSPASDPRGAQSETLDDAVTAVVVKSWAGGSVLLVWQHLNENWNLYGTTQVVIDETTLIDVESFTLADLQNSGADVVIVSNPSGEGATWSQDEIEALATYAASGHNIIGTTYLYRWGGTDNRGLAPLWGHRSDLEYNTWQISAEPTAAIINGSHCLFVDINDPMALGGFPVVQVPADDVSWDTDDMNGAEIVAISENALNVVTRYDAGAYHAYFISYMPEFQDGSDVDATQWLYNAIACPKVATPTLEMSWGAMKAAYR